MDLNKEYELRSLATLGKTAEELNEYDVLILPENYKGNIGDMVDAQDSIQLSKMLKEKGINCANSYDLGLELGTIERRSSDVWLGVIFILKEAVIPGVVGTIVGLVTPMIQARLKKKDSRTPTGAIHTEITVKRNDSLSNIKYSGDAETFLKILESLKNQDNTDNNDKSNVHEIE